MKRVNDVPFDDALFIDMSTKTFYYSNDRGHFSKRVVSRKWNKRFHWYEDTMECFKLDDEEWKDAVKKFSRYNWA